MTEKELNEFKKSYEKQRLLAEKIKKTKDLNILDELGEYKNTFLLIWERKLS